MRRWSMESTFQAARAYLGIDGQRQWHDLAVARSTPARLGLFSLVALIVQRQPAWQALFRQSAWQKKVRPTFADGLAYVRRALWRQLGFWLSQAADDPQKSPQLLSDVPLFFNAQTMHKLRIFSGLCDFLGAFSLWLL